MLTERSASPKRRVTLPKNSVGKVLRRVLRDQETGRADS